MSKAIITVNKPLHLITKGIGHSLSFNTNDYETFKHLLPYQSNELIHVTTSKIELINLEGLTACNGYCITIDTKNSQYKLKDIEKHDYFRILEVVEHV